MSLAADSSTGQTGTLPVRHPTAVAFLDESGSISDDRFFAVGCLKIADASVLLRAIQKLRDTEHWYDEIHWVDLTKDALPTYRRIIDIVAASRARFSCFVADRQQADAVARFGSPWQAYEKLAAQLLIASISPRELVTVLADNYSTPDRVHFEQDVRRAVNRRFERLAVTSACRLDSKACDALQLVDLLTSGVTFEFRQAAGLAGKQSPKARLARYLRHAYGGGSFLQGHRASKMNVAIYTGEKTSP
jgi:hypothetical protein